MKATWLRDFYADIKAIGNSQVVGIHVHSRRDSNWVVDGGSTASATTLDSVLGMTTHLKNGKVCFFALADVEVVVEVEFQRAPKSSTANSFRMELQEIKERSQDRFDAKHDALTGCKNRKSFETDIKSALQVVSVPHKSGVGSLEDGATPAVYLAAFDIDFFKRINDTRGHDYGDLVLRSFSWVLEDECIHACAKFPGNEFSLYRMGGEEFNVIVNGRMDELDVLKWLNSVRSKVQAATIPDDGHLRAFKIDASQVGAIPVESERRITTSVGLARFSGAVVAESKLAAGEIKVQADKALYAAKGAGRNKVVSFSEILKRHGRVIENDKSASVIVIDIGSDVGVEVGREFFVIPERYSGDVEYIVDDGRSRRSLGLMPRLKVAKIAAFDVQSEISFCSITDVRDGIQISSGSLLESIPLGLFGGLHAPHRGLALEDAATQREAVSTSFVDAAADHAVLVTLRLDDVAKIEREHGQLQANETLASASALMSSAFASVGPVTQIELGSFSVVATLPESDFDASIAAFSASVKRSIGQFSNFRIGTFESGAVSEEGLSGISVSHAVDYSMIAAAAAKVNSTHKFGRYSAVEALSRMNDEGLFDEVVASGVKFRDIGIMDGQIRNLLGIALFSRRDYIDAATEFRLSYELEDSAIVRSNCAISQYFSRKYAAAYRNFRAAEIGVSGVNLGAALFGIYAVSAAYSATAGDGPDNAEVDRLFDVAAENGSIKFISEEDLLLERSAWDGYKLNAELDELLQGLKEDFDGMMD